ncbi:copper resistance D family protein [Aquipuribacter hungaricus]|uniref:copper resistance D family protein n=1 Tax=Aquipuribacter hungaricus TaxID=545624 RepID=UPI0030ED29AB
MLLVAGGGLAAVLAALLLASAVEGAAVVDPGTGSAIADRSGATTRLMLMVVRLASDLAVVAVVAGLLVTLLTAPTPRQGVDRSASSVRRQGQGVALPRGVAAWALAWAAAAACLAVLNASDVSNQSVLQVLRTGLLLDYLTVIPQARMQAGAAGVAMSIAVAAAVVGRDRGRPADASEPFVAVVLLVLTAVGVALPLRTGHAASAVDHDFAVTSVVLHVLAATVWVGGLAGLVVHLRRSEPRLLARAVGRFDGVALTAFVVVAASGVTSAWTRLPEWGLVTSSGYGALVMVKVAALVVLGAFGAWHRHRTIGELRAGRPGAFRRLAGVEVVVMAAAAGVAVALARTPTP